MTRIWLLLYLLVGCSDPAASSDDPVDLAIDSRAVDQALPDRAIHDIPTSDLPDGARVCGTLLDTSGDAVFSANVIVCDDVECNMADSGLSGGFCAVVAVAGVYCFHLFERIDGARHYGDVLFPVEVTAAQVAGREVIDLGTVRVPLMGATASLAVQTGGTLKLGAGVEIGVPAGSASRPSRTTTIQVAAAMVNPKHLHPLLLASGPTAKAPVAAALVVPIDTSFATPASYSLPAPASLKAGAALSLLSVDPKTGGLVLAGEAKVSSTGAIVPAIGKGLSALGWLVFVAKP